MEFNPGQKIWIATLTTKFAGDYTFHEMVITDEDLAKEANTHGWVIYEAIVGEVLPKDD